MGKKKTALAKEPAATKETSIWKKLDGETTGGKEKAPTAPPKKAAGKSPRTAGQSAPRDAGKRSSEIVAERNKMAVKQVQRYIWLNEFVHDLMALMDARELGFTTAVELFYIGKKNQNDIAVDAEK